jgi:3-oxoacyl-[acyl-carrier-protein] synthase II
VSSPAPVVISGIGLITPLGSNSFETWNSLLAGRFIRNHGRCTESLPKAKTRVAQLGVAAAREATANWSVSDLRDATLVVGTSKGPIDDWLRAPSTLSDLETGFGIASLAGELADILGILGPRLTTCSACASGLYAIALGMMRLQHQEADRVLVVAAESSLHPLFLSSFQRLGVLAPLAIGCRPFDMNRAGFLCSEAAAAVCLERAASSDNRIRVSRFAMTADATHLTRSAESNEPLKYALAKVVDGHPVDLIHAHGTGTEQNDPAELSAVSDALRNHLEMPNVYSHKGALGHSLGAAGLISVVINVLAHEHGIVPPNIRTEAPIAAGRVRINREIIRRPVQRSVAVAAGFGGHIAAVSLESGVRRVGLGPSHLQVRAS